MQDSSALSIVASSEVLAALRRELTDSPVRSSEPVPAASPADALDSPIGADEVRLGLEIATFVFQVGPVAFGTFRSAVKKVLADEPDTPIEVIDPRTGEALGTFTYATADELPAPSR